MTVDPFTPEPLTVRSEVLLVTLSLLLVPVSSSAARSRPAGTAGAVVSTVTVRAAAELPPVLPARSVWKARTLWIPAESATSTLKAPAAFTVPVASVASPVFLVPLLLVSS